MIPEQFTNFLLASAGASAALIGLLFVAVSLAPERVFGHQAVAEKQTEALSAFTALANAFFISLGGLIPGFNIAALATIAALVALGQTLALLFLWPRWRRERRAVRGLILFLVSAGIYGYELWTAQRLAQSPGAPAALSALCMVLLATYVIGLGRAWNLLGAPHERGLWASLTAELSARGPAEGAERRAPPQAADDTPAAGDRTRGPGQRD